MTYALLTLFFGGLALWLARYLARDARRKLTWGTVYGTILERGVEPESEGRYYPRARYTYAVDGVDYESDQVYAVRRTSGGRRAMERLVDELPDPVPVRYDPEDPAQSFLVEQPRSAFWIAVVFGTVVTIAGLLQLAVALAGG